MPGAPSSVLAPSSDGIEHMMDAKRRPKAFPVLKRKLDSYASHPLETPFWASGPSMAG